MTEYRIVRIPFSGFRESPHESILDETLCFAFQDGDGEPYKGMADKAYQDVNWQKVHESYAREFLSHWSEESGVPAQFVRYEPSESYMIDSDRIFACIKLSDLRAVMFGKLPYPERKRLLHNDRNISSVGNFAVRSGSWKQQSVDWEPDNWGIILARYTELTLAKNWEDEYASGDLNANGDLTVLIESASGKTYDRLANIALYLRERAEREPDYVVLLPFSGFYNTLHDLACDESMQFPFTGEDGELNETLYWDHAHGDVDWDAVRMVYVKDYVELWSDKAGVKVRFDSLSSPREYNFHTDRIFVRIRHSQMLELCRRTDKESWRETCKRMFTSRDGFSSFYKPDPDEWGPPSTWDHNQFGSVVQTFHDSVLDSDGDWDIQAYSDLSEDYRLVGEVQHALGKTYNRAANIAGYLRDRQERVRKREVDNG